MNTATITALAAALAISGFSTAAMAAEPERQHPHRVVTYSDLDLSSDSGRQALERRVRLAAKRVCPATVDRTGRTGNSRRDCINQVVAKAWADVLEQQQRLARIGEAQGNRG